MFVNAEHAVSRKASFLHSNTGTGVEQVNAADYIASNMKSKTPCVRFSRLDDSHREVMIKIISLWSGDKTKIPYGQYPERSISGDQKTEALPLHRIGANKGIQLDSLQFGPNSLLRLMKWTNRYYTRQPISRNRGVTCAPFTLACLQVASICTFFENGGWKADDVATAYHEASKLFDGTKPRDRVEGGAKPLLGKDRKPIEYSNSKGSSTYKEKHSTKAMSDRTVRNAATMERVWSVIISSKFGYDVDEDFSRDLLDEALPAYLRYDAKYTRANMLYNMMNTHKASFVHKEYAA